MGRAPCCDKANVKKGPWSPEEDAKLKSYIEKHGTGGNWIALPQKIGLKRCGKSCRLRWLNYLRPNIKHGGFSEEEDKIILSLYVSIGSRWSIIAAQLPGRTDNDIKNYWNTRLKKKLLGLMVEGQSSTFPPEIEALMSSNNGNNPQREVLDGLEFLYGGVGGGGGGAGGDYGGDHLVNNHEEMISMGSLPNLELDGNALIQGIEEEGSHFEEHMRYPNNVEL
ncbi:unnamed protein product [Amaranthus hypochondriacus]